MKKLLLLTLLTSMILAGCSNAVKEGANNEAPINESVNENENENVNENVDGNENENSNKDETIVKETKAEYTRKLDDIEAGLSDLKPLQDEGTTVSMTKAADETHKRWDKALNEIYEELKVQLSPTDMAELKEEQLKWITYRDEAAKEAALEYKGGTMESLQYISTLARVTKERCYELVELYMK